MVTHNLENLAYVSHAVQIRDGIISEAPRRVQGGVL